jgi:hypothetical protein
MFYVPSFRDLDEDYRPATPEDITDEMVHAFMHAIYEIEEGERPTREDVEYYMPGLVAFLTASFDKPRET